LGDVNPANTKVLPEAKVFVAVKIKVPLDPVKPVTVSAVDCPVTQTGVPLTSKVQAWAVIVVELNPPDKTCH
jgi:hypothetical protein